MRGDDRQLDATLRYVLADQRVPQDYSLRAIRTLVDGVATIFTSRPMPRGRFIATLPQSLFVD